MTSDTAHPMYGDSADVRDQRRAAGEFAAAIMHEINNPLEAALNLTYLITHEAENANLVRSYARTLDEQLRLVMHIASQTLSYYKPSQIRQTTSVISLAEAALRLHTQRLSTKGIHLVKRIATDVTVAVHAGEMLQVISNLVGNAIDALPDKGTLHVIASRTGPCVHITISDNGHGIPEDLLDKVFEPFVTTKNQAGTGLGLAISREIVERHKGTLHTRSCVRSGRSGTSFRISLPATDAERSV